MDKYSGATERGTGLGRARKSTGYESGAGTAGSMTRSRNEDEITSMVEKQTARVPSITFLSLAGAAGIGSLWAFFAGKTETALMIGGWVPTFLILGLYNKIVKETENVGGPVFGS